MPNTKTTLKNYEEQFTETVEFKTIKSGVASPETKEGEAKREMEILTPIEHHPQLKGFVKAIDPETKWIGWVKYEPTVETPEAPVLTPEQQAQVDWFKSLARYRSLVRGNELGILNKAMQDELALLKTSLSETIKDEYISEV